MKNRVWINHATGETRDVHVRTPYNYDVDAATLSTGVDFPTPTLTQQQFAEEVDINTIVKRFGLTGQLPENVRVPEYGDYTEAVTDYQTALNMVIEADEAFMKLPGAVRERFGNNPQKLLEFVSDPANLEEARKLGIANAAAVVPPIVPPKDDSKESKTS